MIHPIKNKDKGSNMLKFKTVKAGILDPETDVIVRADGKQIKDTMYLVINLAKPHGSESYTVLQKHGYHIPEIETFLKKKNQEIGKVKRVTLPGSLLKDRTFYLLKFKFQMPNETTQIMEEKEVTGQFYVIEKVYSFTHNRYIYSLKHIQTSDELWVSEHHIIKYEKLLNDGK